jgi:RNA polymerase sigma factor (sigma-70 family)
MPSLRRAPRSLLLIFQAHPLLARPTVMENALKALELLEAGSSFDFIVSDIKMPGMSGLHLLEKLRQAGIDLPVIIITGYGDVPVAVAAMKGGAVDFIEKPFNEQLLLDSVQNALAQDQAQRQSRLRRQEVIQRFASLTPREEEVMKWVVEGLPNKDIAENLAVSRKTVEVHRAKVMAKMQAESLSDLIQMAIVVGILREYGEIY